MLSRMPSAPSSLLALLLLVSVASGALSMNGVLREIPAFVGAVRIGAPAVQLSSRDALCFHNVTASAVSARDGSITLKLTFEKAKSLLCRDGFLIASLDRLHVMYRFTRGVEVVTWPLPTDPSARADLAVAGLRVFRFLDTPMKTVDDVLATAELMLGGLTGGPGVRQFEAKDNLAFMKDKMNYTMDPRPDKYVDVSSQVQSGDLFGVIRLDGLDPLLAYLMGSQTGHTVIAMRDDAGALWILESTTSSTYWPTNGIQQTPFDTWMKQARAASYCVVHLPLSRESRANFNATKAWQFYRTVKGLTYGFQNMAFGLLDTAEENLPYPFSLELAAIATPMVVKRLKLSLATDLLTQALNKRLGTRNLTTWQCFAAAYARNLTLAQLVTMPEQDTWQYDYDGGRTGPAMVCDVFVSRMWKEGGVFGALSDQINTSEFTDLDIYSLAIFDPIPTIPAACRTAEPYCQVLGAYYIHLHHFNEYVPFAYMRERCPSVPPLYVRPRDC